MEGSGFSVVRGFINYLLAGNEKKHKRAEDAYPFSTSNFPTRCRRVFLVVTVQSHKDFLVACFDVYSNTYYSRLGLGLSSCTTLDHCQC